MIVRVWKGQSTAENVSAYLQHVTRSVFPSLKNIAGFRGSYVLRRDIEGGVEVVVATIWDSMSAVRKFAGEEPERAVVEPQARILLTRYEDTVRHFEVAHQELSRPEPSCS